MAHWKSHKSVCVAIRAHPNGPEIISGSHASWKLNENKEFWFTIAGEQFGVDVENGALHGKGTIKYADGTVYEGDYENGKPHGRGTMKSADGRVFEGDVENEKPNGRFTLKSADGNVFEGDVENGKPHGRGTMKYANTVQEGDWKDDIWLAKGADVSDGAALSAPLAQLSLAASSPTEAGTAASTSTTGTDADADADAAAETVSTASDEDSRSVNSWEFDEDD